MGQWLDPGLPVLSSRSSDYLDTVCQMVTATVPYSAFGTTEDQWIASIITLETSRKAAEPRSRKIEANPI